LKDCFVLLFYTPLTNKLTFITLVRISKGEVINMKSITVFCGSSPGKNPDNMKLAYELGKHLATLNISVVYGGAKIGLMGAVANGSLQNHGKAIGVIPKFLCSKEIAHEGLTELILVESMHERKTRMHELCDGFIALPGGFGTLEELFEILTWAQLGLHQKPIGLLNTNGFYDHLIQLLTGMVNEGYLKQENWDMLLVDSTIQGLLQKMESYIPPVVPKWIKDDEQA